MTYLALLIGGVAGGVLRYALDTILPTPHSFPLSTLVINLIGSFILGLFYGVADVREVKPWLQVGFGTGVIGAFTTFSTFCLDMTTLTSSSLGLAAIYVTSSILGGPFLAFFGDQIVVAALRRTVKDSVQDIEELSV